MRSNIESKTTYLIKVQYDGSNFFGWSKQPKLRTVEGEINKILSKIFHYKIVISGASRTDTKVHAYDQYFTFSLLQSISIEKIKNILNHNFNGDIKICDIKIVNNDYDLRGNIESKQYIYLINTGEINPFLINYQYFYQKKINIKKMQEAFSCFIGRNYFYNYSGLNFNKDKKNPYRTIISIDIEYNNDLVIIKIIGNGFLRYQIRCLVSAALKYCENKLTLEDIKYFLSPECHKKYHLLKVPGSGLYLNKINFINQEKK